ncbi:TetR/AcrR family transcriptional regulator [Natronospirillum operosum]|uniref:TetR/AcrR family transcriptional regulator n=1 Tax=Natronospirillum operosum TaxID=2759953 RepID=A0A4Z0W7U4_9GAMM|nr:TetR/AcrR family transcriptional regulator [Natronospirillum operosum]TGG89981.1 TetR/AcrR family transcriptional regulator [Natronospirillum operosum]
MARRPGITRDRIIEASLLLIQQRGESALTLAALAKHFGVRPPSLYNHVSGLPGLKRELRLHGLNLLAAELQQSAMGNSGSAALTELCHAYRHFAQQQPALYRLTLASTENDDAELQAAGQAGLDAVLSILKGYRLRGDEALHAIRCLRSALHGFVSLEIEGGFAMPLDLDASFGHLIQQLDRMLTNWQT